jgi:hypothetical protein
MTAQSYRIEVTREPNPGPPWDWSCMNPKCSEALLAADGPEVGAAVCPRCGSRMAQAPYARAVER